MSKKIAVLLFSGGLNSTVLGSKLLDEGYNVEAISLNYGQKNDREIQSAIAIAQMLHSKTHLDFNHQVIELPGLQAFASGEFASNMALFCISLASATAVQKEAEKIAFGICGTFDAYQTDVHRAFVRATNSAIKRATKEQVRLSAPFRAMFKSEVVETGKELKTPMSLTWSCLGDWKDNSYHCGKCSGCVQRIQSFVISHVQDNTIYDDKEFWKTAVKENQNEQ